MVPIARCAWSAQNAEESLGSATTEGCAKSDQRLRRALHSPLGDDGGSNLPYLGKSSRHATILQDSSAKKDKDLPISEPSRLWLPSREALKLGSCSRYRSKYSLLAACPFATSLANRDGAFSIHRIAPFLDIRCARQEAVIIRRKFSIQRCVELGSDFCVLD